MSFWAKLKQVTDHVSGEKDAGQELDDEEVRLAAAALLVHATVVDGEADPSERETLSKVLKERFELEQGEIDELIAEASEKERDAVDLYGFTSVLKRDLDRPGCMKIVEMLWEVVIADGVIHEFEANLVWRAAELLGVTSRDRIRLKKTVESRHG